MHIEPTLARSRPRAAKLHPVGRVLPHRLGRYTLFDHVGRGGMADIYLASVKTGLGGSRLCVVKEVLAHLADSPRFAEMLTAEAKLAARLSHANVVTVEHLGREDGALFIAMDYVEGFDLRELLRRCARQRVALPIDFSLLVVCEILRGLDYAHRFRGDDGRPLGIVHRDVSPSNVLASLEGEVKLCDFGIARASDLAAPEDEAIQGKAGYMSPEHARGEPIDARADVFAAGIILWELLAGRRLYRAESTARAGSGSLLETARRAEIPPLVLRGLHDEAALHAIVRRALERDRDARYPTAVAMLRDLEAYASRAQLMASPLRFGDWLMEHFGKELVASRRGRERALAALQRGPVARLEPLFKPTAPTPSAAIDSASSAERAAPETDGELEREADGELQSDASEPEVEDAERAPASLVATSTDLDRAEPRRSSRGALATALLLMLAAVVIHLLRR